MAQKAAIQTYPPIQSDEQVLYSHRDNSNHQKTNPADQAPPHPTSHRAKHARSGHQLISPPPKRQNNAGTSKPTERPRSKPKPQFQIPRKTPGTLQPAACTLHLPVRRSPIRESCKSNQPNNKLEPPPPPPPPSPTQSPSDVPVQYQRLQRQPPTQHHFRLTLTPKPLVGYLPTRKVPKARYPDPDLHVQSARWCRARGLDLGIWIGPEWVTGFGWPMGIVGRRRVRDWNWSGTGLDWTGTG
ncbi:uncharacterized protein N7511_009896 [Penicillium nucicola]|uniref:uncharacterized protein n=1 Tax=Penicillium nucicola TaxID=1850975 RepID=UPI0025457AA2|nr:uncharacterized protein N7511_009896 [Penicillium nucicola]KAJ5748200.1 hypothetical protein N7511_009896 [Penicillium nucicola]